VSDPPATRPVGTVRRLTTDRLTGHEIEAIRRLMWAAFVGDEAFAETDWDHAIGGVHFILERSGRVASHASVVERRLWVDGQPFRAGYVEAVATDPAQQGQGYGTEVMRAVTDHIRDHFEIGALGTGRHAFYERLGWETWRGPTFVRTPNGDRATRDEDGNILVLRTLATPSIEPTASLTCDWREGDVW
jgi:aminoglycoside 2'-N-acetyltransferase I